MNYEAKRKSVRANRLGGTRTFLLVVVLLAGPSSSGYGQPIPCGDYDGCDLVILKVRGTVKSVPGIPVLGAQITGVEDRRDHVNSIEFFNHCGGGLHQTSNVASATTVSAAVPEPGAFELLFIVCATDKDDFSADFTICVEAPDYRQMCLLATFDEDTDRRDLEFALIAEKDLGSQEDGALPQKGLPVGNCGDYDDCSMTLLKVRGTVQDIVGTPISNAEITGVLIDTTDVNAAQFYSHCNDGFHFLSSERVSDSVSAGSTEPGFYELLFAVCGEDNNDVLDDEFDADYRITASAPGFKSQSVMISFDEGDDRDEVNFSLIAGGDEPTATPPPSPTDTPTEAPMETATFTPTEIPTDVPTATPTTGPSQIPTALNPAADVDGSGQIDHNDLLEILENWYRIVQ